MSVLKYLVLTLLSTIHMVLSNFNTFFEYIAQVCLCACFAWHVECCFAIPSDIININSFTPICTSQYAEYIKKMNLHSAVDYESH